MNNVSRAKGSLLVELMFACGLMAIILPLIIPAFWRFRDNHDKAALYLDRQDFRSALAAQFDAHWQRLRPAGCLIDNQFSLTIGNEALVPTRLRSRDLLPESDWLRASDFGACRVSLGEIQNPLNISPICGLEQGDVVDIVTCDARVKGQVLSSTTKHLVLDIEDNSIAGQTGILEKGAPFYWYVASGKNGQSALWRTPQEIGNSLELWSGLQRVNIYPLLDTNLDGTVDTIATHYGRYPLTQVRALWVEYLYELPRCTTKEDLLMSYNTMRGGVWKYSVPCQGVANHIVEFNPLG